AAIAHRNRVLGDERPGSMEHAVAGHPVNRGVLEREGEERVAIGPDPYVAVIEDGVSDSGVFVDVDCPTTGTGVVV
ncbi:MAG: hypothetical protein GTO35_04915, partial [Gammaproteobacteria bacterium]|nr:hypothetical protein [Gammaproteobacteria bacterium]